MRVHHQRRVPRVSRYGSGTALAAATFDASEFLVAKHREEKLDTNFDGQSYASILWHLRVSLPRRNRSDPRVRDLMALTGAEVTMVERCSAIRRHLGTRAENVELARRVAKPLMERVPRADDGAASPATASSRTSPSTRARRRRPVHPLCRCSPAPTESRSDVRKLTVDDIVDLRAYERERAEFRQRIIDLKTTRRVSLGPILTILFENTETMRWQVQEMARAERMLRDEQIAHEVETYNELIPDPGELSGTLFLELTSDDALREWLPKLVGIEFHVGVRVAGRQSCLGRPSDDGRATAHARRHNGGRALPAVLVHARAGARRSNTGRCG